MPRYTSTVTDSITRYARALGVLGQKSVRGRWKTDAILEKLAEHGYTVVIEGDDMIVMDAEGEIVVDPETETDLDAYVAEVAPVSLEDYREKQKALKVLVALGTSAERLAAVEALYQEVASTLPPSSSRYKLQADLVKLSASMPERGDGDDGGTNVVPVEVDTPATAARFIDDGDDAPTVQ